MPLTLARPFPTDFETTFEVLRPEQGLGDEADQQIVDLALHGFVAARGLHVPRATDLIGIAVDPKVEEYCANDRATRFRDVPTMREWVKKNGGRAVLGIYHVNGQEGAIDLADLPKVTVHDVVQVANSWGGEERNKHIIGADVTTAYRSGSLGSHLARLSRRGPDDHFGLGYPLAVLNIANLVAYHGIRRGIISEENWESNTIAGYLYARVGFHEVDGVARERAIRPTLQPWGTLINGHAVRFQTDNEGNELATREVVDYRVFQVLDD